MWTPASARKKTRLFPIALSILVLGCSDPPHSSLEEVEEFGSNPGALRMFKHVPVSLMSKTPTKAVVRADGQDRVPSNENRPAPPVLPGVPLVVALHGCMQDATGYGEDSGWVQLANRWGFLLLLPEQTYRNNLARCFSWFSPEDNRRGKGEALSIRQMVDRMRQDHTIDPQRIYLTGISAGAAMSLVMAAGYPEVFAGVAPVAGIAYGCADGMLSGLSCMREPPDKDAVAWGAAVRSATNHKGPWPRISVWQGEADAAVDPANAEAIVRQWTSVHDIDDTPKMANDLEGHVHALYRDANGQTLVESFRIREMGHGVPVDPGAGENQCGREGRYFLDVGICSGLHITRFWGLSED